jgi:P-type Ca2+ transporter type 2C
MASYWASKTKEDIEKDLSMSVKNGLSEQRAAELLSIYGKNSLGERKKFSFFKNIKEQFKSPLVFVLVLAGVAAYFLGEFIDATVILLAITINVTIGVFQEKRADNSFQKLADSQQKIAVVIRDGKKITIPAEEVVKGDLVVVEAGMLIPADLRLVDVKDLKVNESILTGEWSAVSKEDIVLKPDLPISEQDNMAFMGTLSVSGYAVGVAVRTGASTEVGKIAESLLGIDESDTPIRKNIRKLAKLILVSVVALVLLIFVLGVWRGQAVTEMFLISVAIAVASIPEGLPAAVTVVLAIGMEKILKRGGLVKNLLAAEVLGSTTVILTDKTGTLTEAKMKLTEVLTLDSISNGKISVEDNKEALKIGVLASDAHIEHTGPEGSIEVKGRPIEKAIVSAGLESGLSQEDLYASENKRLDVLPFNSERRFMASLNETGTWPNRIYFSGEPEKILNNSSFVLRGEGVAKKTTVWHEEILKTLSNKTSVGARLIAIAYKDTTWKKFPENEKNVLEELVFVGFLAFSDPVRGDVAEAISKAKDAGARVIMVTGDYPQTAHSVALQTGIISGDSQVITGSDVDSLNDKELYAALKRVNVFARILPHQKLRLSQVLKDHGEIVAMTGDGINDAPALRSADIGVAVESGTEVAKEASDLILLDNSFSVIVSAIEEGRRIIDNLKKIIGYILSTSFGEIIVISGALLLALPLPILPTQILWVNIIGGGLMNFAFAFEDKEKDIMKRNPRNLSARHIASPDILKLIVIAGVVTSLWLMMLYLFMLNTGEPIEDIRTVMFVALSLSAFFFAFSFKSLKEPFWKTNLLANKFLLLALSVSLIILLLSLSLPALQKLLSLSSLDGYQILILVLIGFLNLMTIEAVKKLVYMRKGKE